MVATSVIQEYIDMYDYRWIITKMDTNIVETTKNKDSVKCNIIVVLDEHNRVAINTLS